MAATPRGLTVLTVVVLLLALGGGAALVLGPGRHTRTDLVRIENHTKRLEEVLETQRVVNAAMLSVQRDQRRLVRAQLRLQRLLLRQVRLTGDRSHKIRLETRRILAATSDISAGVSGVLFDTDRLVFLGEQLLEVALDIRRHVREMNRGSERTTERAP